MQSPQGAGRWRDLRLPVLIILALLLTAAPVVGAWTEDISRLRHSVRALWQVRQQVGRTLAGRQGDGALAPKEAREIEIFLAFLLGRIREDCRQLVHLGGSRAVADLDCPAGGAALPAGENSAARTSGEEVERLEQKLARALGEFDDMLLREEKRLAARVPRQRESGGGTGVGGQGGDGRAGGEQGSDGRAAASGEGASATGGRDRDAGQGRDGAAAAGREASPGGRDRSTVETGVAGTAPAAGRRRDEGAMAADDDIVARQLREAAEKETDPALKEKLWQEYRRYKAQQ